MEMDSFYLNINLQDEINETHPDISLIKTINKGETHDRFTFMTKKNGLILSKQNISLHESKAWHFVDSRAEIKVIDIKWAFKVKYDKNGKIVKCKARLVPKIFFQKFGLDYEGRFLPVVLHTTTRVFFSRSVMM